MNVYVIYKFADYDKVAARIEEIKKELSGVYFFMFSPNYKNKLWHRYAKKKMKASNIVAFFDTFEGNESCFKHIAWELGCAEKLRKRIVVFKDQEKRYAKKIYGSDYSEEQINRYRYKVKDIKDAADFLKAEASWRVDQNLMNPEIAKAEGGTADTYYSVLLEQYRIMIDTSERLMERRQSTGNLYTTICAALVAFVGATFGFENLLISACSSLLAGIIITVLCLNWRASLSAYELNNGGKFAVINEIEKHLPADMFECEYRYNTLNGIRSYSSREKRLPAIFMMFGIALALLAVILFVLQFAA